MRSQEHNHHLFWRWGLNDSFQGFSTPKGPTIPKGPLELAAAIGRFLSLLHLQGFLQKLLAKLLGSWIPPAISCLGHHPLPLWPHLPWWFQVSRFWWALNLTEQPEPVRPFWKPPPWKTIHSPSPLQNSPGGQELVGVVCWQVELSAWPPRLQIVKTTHSLTSSRVVGVAIVMPQ